MSLEILRGLHWALYFIRKKNENLSFWVLSLA